MLGLSWQCGRTRGTLTLTRDHMKVSVDLSPADTERLRDEANRLGVSPERLAHATISDLLAHEADDFFKAARRVLEKNRELYRRLA